MYKALVSFVGKINMVKDEVRDLPDHIAQDLLNAKYIERVEKKVEKNPEEKPEKKPEEKPKKKKSAKKKRTPKGDKK